MNCATPDDACFRAGPQTLTIRTPGGVGDILKEPDGGAWLRGEVQKDARSHAPRVIQPGLESLAREVH